MSYLRLKRSKARPPSSLHATTLDLVLSTMRIRGITFRTNEEGPYLANMIARDTMRFMGPLPWDSDVLIGYLTDRIRTVELTHERFTGDDNGTTEAVQKGAPSESGRIRPTPRRLPSFHR